jgi:4a-hydroxytetrahydrobiopterin dehydratase
LGGVRARLDDDAAAARLAELPGWERTGDEIVRTFDCGDFPSAVAFVVRVGFLAEAKDHHPDLDVRWKRVKVALTTHDLGGLSDWDFELASEIDAVAPSDGSRLP